MTKAIHVQRNAAAEERNGPREFPAAKGSPLVKLTYPDGSAVVTLESIKVDNIIDNILAENPSIRHTCDIIAAIARKNAEFLSGIEDSQRVHKKYKANLFCVCAVFEGGTGIIEAESGLSYERCGAVTRRRILFTRGSVDLRPADLQQDNMTSSFARSLALAMNKP